jgi:hypothetical protein
MSRARVCSTRKHQSQCHEREFARCRTMSRDILEQWTAFVGKASRGCAREASRERLKCRATVARDREMAHEVARGSCERRATPRSMRAKEEVIFVQNGPSY